MDALKYLHNVSFSNVSVFSVGQIYIVHEDIDCSRMSYKRSIFKAKLVCKFDSSVGELTLETVVCDEASWRSDHSCGLPHRHYQLNWRRWKQSKMQFRSGRGGGGRAWPLPTVGIRLPIKKLKSEKSANELSSSIDTNTSVPSLRRHLKLHGGKKCWSLTIGQAWSLPTVGILQTGHLSPHYHFSLVLLVDHSLALKRPVQTGKQTVFPLRWHQPLPNCATAQNCTDSEPPSPLRNTRQTSLTPS